MCSFSRLTVRYFCTFDSSSAEMHDRCGAMRALNVHVLLSGGSGDNKKMDDGRCVPLRCTGYTTLQQETAHLCECSVARKGKVNAYFFFSSSLLCKPILSSLCTVVHGGREVGNSFIYLSPPCDQLVNLALRHQTVAELCFTVGSTCDHWKLHIRN